MARKQIKDLIAELHSWLPNYDHGPEDYPTLLWRILASIPGGDQAEDMGYEPFTLGWPEIDQLGRILVEIQNKRDVEELIEGLIGEDPEDLEEAPRRARAGTVSAPREKPFHVYGDNGFESAHLTESAAQRAAKSASTRNRTYTYEVIKTTRGYTGGGHGIVLARYRAGRRID